LDQYLGAPVGLRSCKVTEGSWSQVVGTVRHDASPSDSAFEDPRPMRLNVVGRPDALHGGLGYSHMLGHRTGTPSSQPSGGVTASLKILPLSDALDALWTPAASQLRQATIPSRRKRPRQNVTVCWLVPKVLATWTLSAPIAHSRIRRFSLVPALAIRSPRRHWLHPSGRARESTVYSPTRGGACNQSKVLLPSWSRSNV
jgi:hypothetical protein